MPPTVFPMPPRSYPRPVLPAEVEHEAKEDDAQAPASAPVTAATPPTDPVAMIEEVSIKDLVLAVGELKTEVSKVTTPIIDDLKGQGTDWTKVGGIVAMIGLPFVVLGAYFAWLTLNQSSGAGPAVSPTPSALASSALPSPVPSPTQSPTPSPIVRPTASPTPATSPRASTGGAASQIFVSSLLRVVLVEPPRYTRWSPPSYPRGPAIAGGDLRMASSEQRRSGPCSGVTERVLPHDGPAQLGPSSSARKRMASSPATSAPSRPPGSGRSTSSCSSSSGAGGSTSAHQRLSPTRGGSPSRPGASPWTSTLG